MAGQQGQAEGVEELQTGWDQGAGRGAVWEVHQGAGLWVVLTEVELFLEQGVG